MVTTRKKRTIKEKPSASPPTKKPTNKESTPTMEEPKPAPVKNPKVYQLGCTDRSAYMDAIELRANRIEAGHMGWDIEDGVKAIRSDYGYIGPLLRPWTSNYSLQEPHADKYLSADQKKMIISSLKDSCVQEDWDELKMRFPSLIRREIVEVFLEALVLKDIFARFFENPFWYFDGKTSPSDQTGDGDFSARLQYLYERYLKTNPYSAANWRSETIRLANSVNQMQAENQELGFYHKDRRIAAINDMVDALIASEPICWLLKKPLSEEEESERHRVLVSIYKKIADMSPKHGAKRGYFEFHRLDDLNKSFHVASDTMAAYNYHFLPKDDTRLDCRRVLLVLQPATVLRWTVVDRKYERQVCSKARVVVEDPHGQEGPEWDWQD